MLLDYKIWDERANKFLPSPQWNVMLCCNGSTHDKIENAEWMQNKRYIVLLNSGLKDKNGTTIYKGDILACPFSDKMLTSKSVKTKVFNFPMDFKDGKFRWNSGRVIIHPFRFHPHIDQCEIIGNIYENPELVTKEPFYPQMKEV